MANVGSRTGSGRIGRACADKARWSTNKLAREVGSEAEVCVCEHEGGTGGW